MYLDLHSSSEYCFNQVRNWSAHSRIQVYQDIPRNVQRRTFSDLIHFLIAMQIFSLLSPLLSQYLALHLSAFMNTVFPLPIP